MQKEPVSREEVIELAKKMAPEKLARYKTRVPLGRIGEPEDVAIESLVPGAVAGGVHLDARLAVTRAVHHDTSAPLRELAHRSSNGVDVTMLWDPASDQVRVAGTIIGNDNHHWLVSALGFELEMQLAFDPDYDTLPLEHFEPAAREVFATPHML